MFAAFKVFFHAQAQFRVHLSVDVIRQLTPNMETTDLYDPRVHQGLTFFQLPSSLDHPPS